MDTREKMLRPEARSARLRRPKSLIMYWQGQDVVFENYLTGSTVVADELIVTLLKHFDTWTEATNVLPMFEQYEPESLLENLEQLLESDMLVTEPSDDDEFLDSAWPPLWGQETRFFHFGSRYAPPAIDEQEALPKGTAPPALKRYPAAARVYLPRAFSPSESRFQDVLLGRRTTRRFSDSPVKLCAFSTLMFYAFSPMFITGAGIFGPLALKNNASAGAKHEAEIYVGVSNVEGLERGLYHYCSEDHSLELLNDDWDHGRAASLCYEQEAIAESSFVCFVSCRFERIAWKYPNPSAYRSVLINLGHIGQAFSMIATSLGIATFSTTAVSERGVDSLLGLDGFHETTMYVLSGGVGREKGDTLPRDLYPPMVKRETIVQMFDSPETTP